MLSLSSGNMSVDAQLFIFTLTEDEQPHQLIAYTQHRSPNHRWVCQLDLDGGSYALVPYTTGCFLKPRERGPVAPQPVPLVDEEDGRIKLTPACMWETTSVQLTYLLAHSLTQLFTPLTLSLLSLTYLLTCYLSMLTYSFILLIHSYTHAHTHSLTHRSLSSHLQVIDLRKPIGSEDLSREDQ